MTQDAILHDRIARQAHKDHYARSRPVPRWLLPAMIVGMVLAFVIAHGLVHQAIPPLKHWLMEKPQ